MTTRQARPAPVVLVVDDEPLVLRIVARQVLAHGGYEVLTAIDGRTALMLLEELGRPVDLLLTDVRMPGLAGDELARVALARGLARQVLFVSGFDDHRQELLQIAPVLQKPFSVEQLHQAVEQRLRGQPVLEITATLRAAE